MLPTTLYSLALVSASIAILLLCWLMPTPFSTFCRPPPSGVHILLQVAGKQLLCLLTCSFRGVGSLWHMFSFLPKTFLSGDHGSFFRNKDNLDIRWKMDRNRFKPQAICSNSHAFLLGLAHANICRMIFSHVPVVSLSTSASSEDFLPSSWYLCESQCLSLTLLCEPYLYQERVFDSVPDCFI